jgi:TonB family protein
MSDLRDDIMRYKRGELSPAEMHALEKKALTDPFLADALEGTEAISVEDLAEDITAIHQSIRSKRQPVFTPLRIAAGVILIIGAGLFLFFPRDNQEMIASKEASGKKIEADTITQSAGLPPKAAEIEKQLAQAEQPKPDVASSQTRDLKKKQVKPNPTGEEKLNGRIAGVTVSDSARESEAVAQLSIQDTTAFAVAPTVTESKDASVRNTTKVSGNVTVAEDGLPLPGVNVTVKGTSIGTTTDIHGNYVLDAPANSELLFSFIGMQTNQQQVTSNGKLDVKMSEDVSQLSEVVIVGHAIQRPSSDEPLVRLAEPVGGIKAYDKYMEDNLRYPQQALDNNVKGRVVVEFNVDVDGRISDFVVMRSLGYGCDDEVIRLVKEGPQWRPTTEDNVPVQSAVRVRMKFDPTKAKKTK